MENVERIDIIQLRLALIRDLSIQREIRDKNNGINNLVDALIKDIKEANKKEKAIDYWNIINYGGYTYFKPICEGKKVEHTTMRMPECNIFYIKDFIEKNCNEFFKVKEIQDKNEKIGEILITFPK